MRTYSEKKYAGSNIDTFDITDFAKSNTRIRFYVKNLQKNSRGIYFDDVHIEYIFGA